MERAIEWLAPSPALVIGGRAMLAYGLPRSTVDLDLLLPHADALRRPPPPAADVEVRVASDSTDPLDGVVEWSGEEGDERVPVQVVVLERRWLLPLLAEQGPALRMGELTLPVVAAPAFVALKLYAGGPRDRADLALLATHRDWERWRAEFEAVLATMPPLVQKRWHRWRPGEPEE